VSADQRPADEGPSDCFWSLFAVARELRRQVGELMAAEPWVADAGFRPPCMGVLSCVAAMGPVSQRRISDELGLDASDVVGVLDVLEAARLVERRRDPSDRRRHAVVLTPAGRKAAERLVAIRSAAVDRVLSGLGPDERRMLADLLDRAHAAHTGSGHGPHFAHVRASSA
jgi:DNA-binding MarR family transcriptional regulator